MEQGPGGVPRIAARQAAFAGGIELKPDASAQRDFLPRTVVVLGLVSLLNDTASEMITPLLPVFLTVTLGGGAFVVGLVEGVAEATSSLVKVVSGWLADRGWNAKRLVLGGYSLSNFARPLIGLAGGWATVLALRFVDRIGKGIRTAPRDALIAASVGATQRGRAFGFQRALDHAGAMLGPLLAFVLLQAGLGMRPVFYWSLLPGVAVLALLLFGLPRTSLEGTLPAPASRLQWRELDGRLRGLILAAAGLAFAAVPEVFLVLWATTHGLQLAWVPLIWAAASAAKFAVAGPAGMLSDRWGRLPVVLSGWTTRVLLLLALAVTGTHAALVWAVFVLYAASLSFTEGAERALIGDFAPAGKKATVYGLYHMLSGLLALPGAVLFGALWQWFGEGVAFVTAAVVTAVMAAALLIRARRAVRG